MILVLSKTAKLAGIRSTANEILRTAAKSQLEEPKRHVFHHSCQSQIPTSRDSSHGGFRRRYCLL